MLNLRLDFPVRKIRTKAGILTLQDARLSCDKRMAYAAVGGGLNAESAIRFSGQKESER